MERAHSVLTSIEIDALVDFFTFYMGMDTRSKLAINYPVIYSKLFPRNPMQVSRVSDGHVIGTFTTSTEAK